MKKPLIVTALTLVATLTVPTSLFAQGMMNFQSSSSDSATIQGQQQEEQKGKKLLDDLNNKTIACSQLKDSDFDTIGEYFMGQSIGDTSRHIAMNDMMKRMMGETSEEQMHTAWGKRGSGCDTSSTSPEQGFGGMPMMGNFASSPMGWGFGVFGGIAMILWWVLIIVGIVAMIKWLASQSRSTHHHEQSALEILKERYAKGEMDKKEYMEKKKDLIT